jgi:L,D-transpeptidase ErfK/SrfK
MELRGRRRGHWEVTTRLALAAALCLLTACGEGDRRLPFDNDALVGELRRVQFDKAMPALDVARRYAVGVNELARANPQVPDLRSGRVPAGAELVVPTQFVLPDAPRRGIVVNIAEMRLYYFPESNTWRAASVLTFPAAVGREEWETPTGETVIAERIKDPEWYPPESIRKEAADKGQELPEVVPAGPDNPLGRYALRLGWRKHLIHGTNDPRSIGKPATHGCIRLYPEDMEALFERVREGTPVVLVDQPYKLGASGGALYLETHKDTRGNGDRQHVLQKIEQWVRARDGRRIDQAAVNRALAQPTEMPVKVSL